MNATYDHLITLLTERFGVERTEVGPDVTYVDLDLDSLALVELALVAEQEFGVVIGDDEIRPSYSLTATVDLIEGKRVAA